jgi:hypothetical protein
MMSFMPRHLKHQLGGLALAAMVGTTAMVGFAGSVARAADDGEMELLDTKILRGILKGLGLKRGDEESIDYRERSPLVLPPNKDLNQLPPPESVNVKKIPDWPDDPDVKRVRQRKEAERKRKPDEPGVDDRPLLPDKLTERPAPPSGGSKAGEAPGQSIEGASRPSTTSELGAKGITSMFSSLWAPKEEYVPFTGEPQRSSLTEPPAGYRTPSPNQPFGVGPEKWKPPVIDRQEPVR